jgi:hypothetical protein
LRPNPDYALSTNLQKPRKLVLWIIWFATLNAVIVYQIALGQGGPHGVNAASSTLPPIFWAAMVQLAAAAFIRWLLLPGASTYQKILVLMIVGLAWSEAVEFYGLFLIPTDQPQTKLGLWILSLLGVVQFAPINA